MSGGQAPPVDVTAFRKLKLLGCLTSYSPRGYFGGELAGALHQLTQQRRAMEAVPTVADASVLEVSEEELNPAS